MENNDRKGRRPRIARKFNGVRNSENHSFDKPYRRREDSFEDQGEQRGPKRSYNREDREQRTDRRGYDSERRNSNRGERSYNRDDRGYSRQDRDDRRERRPYNSEDREQRTDRRGYNNERGYNNRSERNYNREDRGENRERRSYGSDRENSFRQDRDDRRERRSYNNEDREQRTDRRGYNNDRRDNNRGERSYNREDRGYNREDRGENRQRRSYNREERGYNRERNYSDRRSYGDKPRRTDGYERRNSHRGDFERGNSEGYEAQFTTDNDGLVRLNKYISNSGICSRREADELIKAGAVTVNGEVVTEMGHKVKPEDIVVYGGERLSSERKKYLLLNKPKGYITTLDDPQKRNTVLALIEGACKERLYPVGRLDRNTTGLLLFTNDGELTKKLTHPSFGAKKIYSATLDKPLSKVDIDSLLSGIELEDGQAHADQVEYAMDGSDKKCVGVELHSGKNRIVRRMFEALGYEVVKLDRVSFAGLTKKALPKGAWRFLTDQEVSFLKMLPNNK